ncbi:hypothetical protein EV193_105289 [Herbihabitans rhizosphaerae]|uniref:Uncharacterized protein n=1 Tax=Herbihabitans rhizosphaerae TaxID=1872711 RepID=A0A4Q7KPV7_9PSEU|nr:hypothetical protein [Herbihabitans rhizosphaerae]RZS37731.1 hypothetical protein EV193_105289 [Herbihabitans rhizosphaerae]
MTQQHLNQMPAAQPARRRARWERYRVTNPFSPKALAGLWGSIVAVVALAALLGWALEMRGGTVIVLAIPFIAAWFENQRTVFQFDPAGVRVGNVILPWTDVTQFVVATPPNGPVLMGARLRPGASLPEGAIVPPPNQAMPAPIHVAVQPQKFDLAKMVAKARKYAPPNVRIVVADPTGERVAS